MLHHVVREFDRIPRAQFEPKLLRWLQRFDQAFAVASVQSVFDWNLVDYIRVQNYVGIIQVPGLVIEILPKLTSSATPDQPLDKNSSERRLAQQNLLYMLSLAGELPFEQRRLADQHLSDMSLLELLIFAFAQALLHELRRGVPREYVQRQENLACVRGKILHGPNSRLNAGHRERIFLQYEEFLADTPLNRVLKAICQRLLHLPLRARTQVLLRESLLELVDVDDVHVTPESFRQVHLNRNTERFSPLVAFCRMVLLGQMPLPGLGNERTFSLLFPMEQVFEAFVAGFIRRHIRELGLMPSQVRIQSAGIARWLVKAPEGRGRFSLRPDIIITDAASQPRTILDTKWKRLKSDDEDARNGIAQADLYQLYAYAHRFDSPDNLLLYPAVPGASAKTYLLQDMGRPGRLRVEFLDLNRDLRRQRPSLLADMRRIMGLPSVVTASPQETTCPTIGS